MTEQAYKHDGFFERIDTPPGSSLDYAIEKLVGQATRRNCRVVSDFNGVDIEAEPGITPSTVAWLWDKKREELMRAAELMRQIKRQNDLKAAVCDYLIQVNTDHDDTNLPIRDRHPFIPPTAIDWLGNGIVTEVLRVIGNK